jgi:hypothetical protein
MPYYDNWGWLSVAEIPGRHTDTAAPTDIPEGHAANWTGHTWLVMPYSAPPTPVAPEPEPLVATRRQVKLALLQIGLLDTVEAAVAASGDRHMQISYADALEFDRNDPFVVSLGQALGKTDEEMDAVWSLARTL